MCPDPVVRKIIKQLWAENIMVSFVLFILIEYQQKKDYRVLYMDVESSLRAVMEDEDKLEAREQDFTCLKVLLCTLCFPPTLTVIRRSVE